MVHLEGVLGDDFVGLVLAFSDTHEPAHPRRRGTARARAEAARATVGEPRAVAIASPWIEVLGAGGGWRVG